MDGDNCLLRSDSVRARTMRVTKALSQDKESCGSDTPHEEKVISFFEDVTNLAFVPFHQWAKSSR
ncbi:hypothetical protein [Lentibacillus sp. CBA3610]|uniref:hypothetical protein n=1 Tax=Lentibacillus sp. CBA3610 TaxID=2518176 RepID=UPI0015953273|nr:hypothetical protein [Lentibacillus sp. CBA3610]